MYTAIRRGSREFVAGMTPTIYRYRRPGEPSWQWEPLVVEETWYAARAHVRVILECDNPEVEDTELEPPLPEIIPPPQTLRRCTHIMSGTDGERCWLSLGHRGSHRRSPKPHQEWSKSRRKRCR